MRFWWSKTRKPDPLLEKIDGLVMEMHLADEDRYDECLSEILDAINQSRAGQGLE